MSKKKKQGVTNLFEGEAVTFTGSTVKEFLEQAEVLKSFVDEQPDDMHPHAGIYAQADNHYHINKAGMLVYVSGDNTTPLCYGSIIITDELLKNDGAGSEYCFRVEGITQSGTKLPPYTVPASEFDSLNWMRKAWGSSIVVCAGQTTKQKLVAGILLTGRFASKATIYTHTGYIMSDNKPIDYVSAAGSLLNSELKSELDNNLSRYQLAGVSHNRDELKQGILSSIELLNAHELEVTAPLFAFVYLAPIMPIINSVIGETGFCLYLQGKTQSGKSTLAALAASHFGGFSSMTPPVSFASTANYINELAFILKDMPLWVDDYHPQGTQREQNKQDSIFQTIARAAGDHSARGRLNSTAKLQTYHAPRCLFLVTGEDVPKIGQSGSARVFTLNVMRCRADISKLQRNARDGVLSRCMSDYISFIISNYDALKMSLSKQYEDISSHTNSIYGECRLSNQVSLLMVSASLFLEYASEAGAVTAEQKTDILSKITKSILQSANEKENQLTLEDPCDMYITALKDLIRSGRGVLIDLDEQRHRDYPKYDMSFDKNCIGWKDSKGYYIEPNAGYKAVSEYYKGENGMFNINRLMLQRRLYDARYLVGDSSNNPTVKKRLDGERLVTVLRFTRELIEGDTADGV